MMIIMQASLCVVSFCSLYSSIVFRLLLLSQFLVLVTVFFLWAYLSEINLID